MKSFKDIYKNSENKIIGIAAAPGIVIGQVYLFSKEKLEISKAPITDIEEAIKNFEEGLRQSKKELNKIFGIAREKMDEVRAAIFEAQLMILDDPILLDNIEKRIRTEKVQPEFIVADEISKYQELMIISHESYMKERAHDIEDIKYRIIRNLQNKRWQSKIDKNLIVVSEALTPADTLLFSRRESLAFVTDHGGLTSHAAIISRSLNIPAVVGTHNATQLIKDGDTIVVDGFHGYIIINPSEDQLKFFSEKQKKLVEIQKGLEELKELPSVTIDGKEIKLDANVDVTGEIDVVITSGAAGIGLYRSEQILNELGTFPDEEEQTEIYSKLSTLDEVRRSLKIIQECKSELKKEKIKFDNNIKVGIMIEVPSAAVMAKDYAEEIDFISIGTNDLIQYMMAVDRGNDLVSNLYQEFSPVVIRTIDHIVKAAKHSKTPVSICGEMAADTLAIPLLVGLGLDSLSMSPTTILYAKRIIRNFEYKKAKLLAEECLECKTEVEIQKKVKKFFDDNNIIRTRNII